MLSTSIQRLSTCLLFTFTLGACSHHQAQEGSSASPKHMPPMPVTALRVQAQNLSNHIEVVGQTEGFKEVEVRARISGLLVKQLYKEGSLVKAGQALFQIDPIPFKIAVAQARATLAEAKARTTQASREAHRLQGLLTKQAISRKEVDDAQTTQQLMQAALENAQAGYQQAMLNLSYATVTAPASGLSGRAVHTEGNLIGAGTDSLLTTIVQTDPIRVRFSVSENDITRLGIGRLTNTTLRTIELIQPDGNVYARHGKLDFLANQIDPTLGTRSLRAQFDNPHQEVLPGQFVRLRLITTAQRAMFLVPQVAVLQTDKGYNVFVVNSNNQVTPRPVQVGEWSGRDWIISGGLKADDEVIIDNLIKLKPGMTVAPKFVQQPPAGISKSKS